MPRLRRCSIRTASATVTGPGERGLAIEVVTTCRGAAPLTMSNGGVSSSLTHSVEPNAMVWCANLLFPTRTCPYRPQTHIDPILVFTGWWEFMEALFDVTRQHQPPIASLGRSDLLAQVLHAHRWHLSSLIYSQDLPNAHTLDRAKDQYVLRRLKIDNVA